MNRLFRFGSVQNAVKFIKMSKKCKLDSGLGGSARVCTGRDVQSSIRTENETKSGYVYLTPPQKSPTDKKEYSVIRLTNGLTALLVTDHPVMEISDKPPSEQSDRVSESTDGAESGGETSWSEVSDDETEEKIAACALCVGVGSFSDPKDIPGLAHFLEHMVFMGSEKYPTENEFDAFIKRKGGSDNASTQCEHTTFYFECQDEYMQEAMDIFSQFFISPLMKYEAMARERQAIESEFQMAIPSDSHRRSQLLCALANDQNPAKKFMWGNLETLRDNVEDKKLYESVHEFRKRHYSAHRMTLAVQARLPQHILASWVHESFSKVENNNLGPDDLSMTEPPFDMEKFNRIYYIEPVKDICEVELTWPLPPLQHLYKKKPLEYISWLLGHEGKGGLLSWLKKSVWALGIVAGEVDDIGSHSLFSLVSVKIHLSEEGFKNLDKCLDATFSYIKLLQEKGPVERIFQEIQKVSDMNFKFFDEVSPVENVENLVENMQLYPSEHYISGSELHFEYDPDEIRKILDLITPNSVNIMVSHKKIGEQYDLDQTEKWFGTKYTSRPIPNTWLESWKQGDKRNEFYLPEPNIYIPDKFDLHPVDGDNAQDKYPRKISNNDKMELWYKEDVKFKLPQAYIYFYLISSEHQVNSVQRTMVDLYTTALGQLLTEETYPAVVAEMGYTISCLEKGLVFCIYGFDQNLHLLVNKISDGILSFKENLTPDLFDAIKRLQNRYYTNQNLKTNVLAKDLRMSITLDQYTSMTERLNALEEITFEKLLDFSDKYYENMYIKGLIQGNIPENKAKEISERLTNNLVKNKITEKPEVRVCRLEEGQTNVRAKSFNPDDTNCITVTYFQHQPGTIREYCLIEILMMLLEEPLFDTLRTQEQLGYDVSCTTRDTYGILGFSISVVSQRDLVTVDHVEERIISFLKTSLKRLKTISKEEFDEAVTAIIKLKQYSDVHLKEEVTRNWAEIKNGEYVFDRLEKEIQFLQNIKPEEVYSFLAKQIGSKGRFLLVQVVSEKEDTQPDLTSIKLLSPQTGKAGQRYITNIAGFKKQLHVYPPSLINK